MVRPFRRLVDSVRERSGVLFALASGGLLARFPWARLADSDLVVVPLSVVANVAAELGVVATAIEFGLLYVIYASVAPSLIPVEPDRDAVGDGLTDPADRPLDDRPWFGRLVAGCSLGFAVLLYAYMFLDRGSDPSSGWFLVGGVGWSAASVAALTLYLYRTTGGLAVGNPAVELLDAVTPFDDADDALGRALGLSGAWRRVELATWWLGAGFLLLVPTFLLGLVGGVLSGFFPLLEGLVVGWLAVDRAATLLPATVSARLPASRRVEIDLRLFAAIRTALGSVKGAVATLFAFLGVAFAAGTFSIGVGLTPDVIDLLRVYVAGLATPGFPVLHATAILLDGLSGVLTSLLVGTYGLWYWLRSLRRLPLFLAWWQDARRAEPTTTETAPLGDAPALPPGYMLPPSAMVVLAFDWAAPATVVASNRSEYLLLWGLALAATLWTVARAVDWRPQPPRSDGFAVPLAVAIQLSGFFVGGLFAGTTAPSAVAFLWLVLLMAYYLPDAYAVAGRHEDDWLRFGHGGYLLVWAGILAALSLRWTGGRLASLVAIVVAVCGLALVFGSAWDDRFLHE